MRTFAVLFIVAIIICAAATCAYAQVLVSNYENMKKIQRQNFYIPSNVATTDKSGGRSKW